MCFFELWWAMCVNAACLLACMAFYLLMYTAICHLAHMPLSYCYEKRLSVSLHLYVYIDIYIFLSSCVYALQYVILIPLCAKPAIWCSVLLIQFPLCILCVSHQPYTYFFLKSQIRFIWQSKIIVFILSILNEFDLLMEKHAVINFSMHHMQNIFLSESEPFTPSNTWGSYV